MPDNLAYTHAGLLTAGMGGFPLGDLYHWFPDKYAQWKLQEAAENTRINYWLTTGRDTIIVEVKEGPLLVDQFELGQNYPNPFNPSTNIRFTIKSSQFTILKVFDVLGREVASLVNEELNPGSYERVFDGSRFASGVYFYRLHSGSFTQTKKFVLAK
ncbi:MAG: T9SS type A sorting domain-containing protein [Ignavibacteriae bacterium]|nr:T9SS type A sorting domain-containing protein [Ignavibacteriota bacterium]